MGDKIHRNSLQPGHKLHWYRIEKILGQGGFGITYLAQDFNLDRKVAIKKYLPIELAVRERDFSVHPVTEEHGEKFRWGLDRFITEARTLVKFKHPNIVHVLNVFEANNTAYMVMEYEQGESLQEILTRRKTMEEAELISILIPVLGGLQKVHEAGFIHRDIKPANIFIRNDGSPVLLDFGSARQALGIATQTLTSLVSPGYAPYEQYYSKSDQQGPWSDIYGLGATLYRAIAGVVPMDAVDRSQVILKGGRDTFVSAVEIGKGRYSERFLLAIDHALQFKEGDRPQTISAWKSEFDLPEDPIKKAVIAERASTQPGTKVLETQKRKVWLSGKVAILGVIIGLAITYFYWGEIQDYEEMYRLQKSAEEGDRYAQYKLGNRYNRRIVGYPYDYKKAAYWYQKAAEQDHAEAQLSLGFMYENGEGVPQDLEQAVYWYQKAAEQGDAWAQYILGARYFKGKGVPQDAKQAAYWYQRAAEQGYSDAQFNLGVMYENGNGVSQDLDMALRWYEEAAESGHTEAKLTLELMYDFGLPLSKVDTVFIKEIQKDAELGSADSEFELGVYYLLGKGVSQDIEKALHWFQMAAEQGYSDAQFNLGVMYAKGNGVIQDDKQAIYWFQKASERGHARAQFNSGYMYLNGKGVPKDATKGMHWLRKAADNGNKTAIIFLSERKK